MANAATRQALYRRPGETVYGTLIDGTLTNGDFDITLEPGFWRIALLVMANGVSAGTIQCMHLNAAGTVLGEETLLMNSASGTIAAAFSLIDVVGPVMVLTAGSATVQVFSPIPVYNTLRFTIASIAGAGVTNRIDYIATRVN